MTARIRLATVGFSLIASVALATGCGKNAAPPPNANKGVNVPDETKDKNAPGMPGAPEPGAPAENQTTQPQQ